MECDFIHIDDWGVGVILSFNCEDTNETIVILYCTEIQINCCSVQNSLKNVIQKLSWWCKARTITKYFWPITRKHTSYIVLIFSLIMRNPQFVQYNPYLIIDHDDYFANDFWNKKCFSMNYFPPLWVWLIFLSCKFHPQKGFAKYE